MYTLGLTGENTKFIEKNEVRRNGRDHNYQCHLLLCLMRENIPKERALLYNAFCFPALERIVQDTFGESAAFVRKNSFYLWGVLKQTLTHASSSSAGE